MSKMIETAAWPTNSQATRSLREKSWTVVLRCYRCRRNFAVPKVTLDRLALAPQIMPCRHCGAHPSLSSQLQLHKIADLREDTNEATAQTDTPADA